MYPSETAPNLALLLLRLGVGGLMLTHGIPKLGKLFGPGPVEFGDPIGVGPGVSLALTVFAEVLCSGLLMVGLFTRLATVPLLITMLVAVFVVHQTDGLAKQELPLLYALTYLTLLLTGPGKLSLDASLFK